MHDKYFDKVNLPPQDLSRLSFCGKKPAQVKSWVESLPATRIKHISVLLYKTLPEVNRLQVKANHRWQILEHLRPLVHQCIEGLADEFLEHSINLPDQFAKIAAVAQALQRHLSDGYILVCRELAQQNTLSKQNSQEIALATSRAFHGMGQLLYRGYQLYVPQPCYFWHKVHNLYVLAKHYQYDQIPINDSSLKSIKYHTIHDSYLRLLLLSCSHTNQLRPLEINYIYHSLEHWCQFAQLSNPGNDNSNSVYWVDPHADVGAIYKERLAHQNSTVFALNINALIDHIGNHSHDKDVLENTDAAIPKAVKTSLIKHLLSCWQEAKQRKEVRQETCTKVEVCIGLGQAHEQLTGGIPLEQFLENNSESKSQAATHCDNIITLIATDISPKGYCLKWDREQTMPNSLRAGEFVIIKQPSNNRWEVGTIRWVQRLNNECYIGIERLDQYASPYAIKTTLDNGKDTPFFRAMMLSEKDLNDSYNRGNSCTKIVTPSMPFAVNQKVSLNHYGDCLQIQLTQLLSGSGSISQYQYRPLA